MYQAHARRNQLAQAAAQAHSSRTRAGYPSRASDELSYGRFVRSSNIFRGLKFC
jgi:hypothetical protein